MVWMIKDLFLTDGLNEWDLKDGNTYELPDYWASQIIKQEYGCEYIKIK